MVKDPCPMHRYPPASPPPPSLSGSCEGLQNSWVFERLKFLKHINELATAKGVSPLAKIASLQDCDVVL